MENKAKDVRWVEKKDLSGTSRDTLRQIMWRVWKFLATFVKRFAGPEMVCVITLQNITDSNDVFSSRTRNSLRVHRHREH